MAIKLGPVLSGAGPITQKFGVDPDYYKPYGFNGHEGVDISAKEGTIVAAAHDGDVVSAGPTGSNYGNAIYLWDTNRNIKTLYAHLQSVAVKEGQAVKEGDLIGYSGNTGKTTGPHLHFGVMRTKTTSGLLGGLSVGTIQSPEPANPNNGYKGWEDPLNTSIYDWPVQFYAELTGGVVTSPGSTTVPAAIYGGTTVTFDEIFAKYYIGWGRIEAAADFQIAYGGDLNKLLIARGITTGTAPPAPTAPVNLGIPGQLELDTAKAMANFGKKLPGVYIKLVGEWIYATKGIPDFYPIGKSHFADNNGTMFAALGGYIAVPCDGNNYEGYGQDRRYSGDEFKSAGGNVSSVRVIEPPPPTPTPTVPTLPTPTVPIPPQPPPYVPEQPPTIPVITGEGGVDFTQIMAKLESILQKVDQVLVKLGQAPAPTVPEAEIPTAPYTSININSVPTRASVYLDGEFLHDYTPLNIPYPTAAGSHVIEIRKTGYNTIKGTIEVPTGQTFTKTFTLVKTSA